MQNKNKKHLDFEINLIPCIDLLSVCICFLLLTAVWLNIGSMNVKQAIGGQSAAETEQKPVLWVGMGSNGQIQLEIQKTNAVPANLRRVSIAGNQGKIDLEKVNKVVETYKAAVPNLKTALVQPQANSVYEEIIDLMDEFKKMSLLDIGVVPL